MLGPPSSLNAAGSMTLIWNVSSFRCRSLIPSATSSAVIFRPTLYSCSFIPYHSRYLMSAPRGYSGIEPSLTAYQPTQKGFAEPQSIDRNVIQSFGISKGLMTCFSTLNSGKNAPAITFQSPAKYMSTSCSLPRLFSRSMYSGSFASRILLSVTFDLTNMRLPPRLSFGISTPPFGNRSICQYSLIHPWPTPPGFPVLRIRLFGMLMAPLRRRVFIWL